MFTACKKVLNSQRGSAFIENGLWLALVVIGIVGTLSGLSRVISSGFVGVTDQVEESFTSAGINVNQ